MKNVTTNPLAILEEIKRVANNKEELEAIQNDIAFALPEGEIRDALLRLVQRFLDKKPLNINPNRPLTKAEEKLAFDLATISCNKNFGGGDWNTYFACTLHYKRKEVLETTNSLYDILNQIS